MQARPSPKTGHPVLPDLVDGLDLSVTGLTAHDDRAELDALIAVIRNAEYWLSFDLAKFEPCLQKLPSPLRELAVGITLRFGESVDGQLRAAEIESARGLTDTLPAPVADALRAGLESLDRMVRARDGQQRWLDEGFRLYKPATSLSVHALRASGQCNISIDTSGEHVLVGEPAVLSATDERRRTIGPPEIETALEAPVLIRDDPETLRRTIVLTVPGPYRVRVAGRASGDRKVIAR